MTKRCLDEGLIQSYLDGELSPEETARTEAHMAGCESCAAGVREAEAELAVFMRAFEADAALSVPTERLRERVEASVAGLQVSESRRTVEPEREGWSLRGWLASLADVFALTPARAVAFGGLAAVLAFGVLFAVVRRDVKPSADEMARSNKPTPGAAAAEAVRPTQETRDAGETTTNGTQSSKGLTEGKTEGEPEGRTEGETLVAANQPRVVSASVKRAPAPRRAVVREARTNAAPEKNAGEKLLPGEERYIQSIASLEKTVQGVSDLVLQPSVRAEFERNVEVVNQAIGASRRNALRNPKDREAAKFLFSAYQSKVELLSAVVEQAQVAALNP
ncbi:MAG TPA: zf-HC2 domain-containing protein [Pyrinomonadaceae bacterium]|nr:zf-HC2 domain-containing protein [Pyrinomonadaceae bacterium]